MARPLACIAVVALLQCSTAATEAAAARVRPKAAFAYPTASLFLQRVVSAPTAPHTTCNCACNVDRSIRHQQRLGRGVALLAKKEGNGKEAEQERKKDEELGIYGYPLEVIEREQAEAPFRKIWMGVYALAATTGLLCVVLSGGALAGVPEVQKIAEALPNPGLDAAVLGLTFYFWREEVKVKRMRLREVDAEYQDELRYNKRRKKPAQSPSSEEEEQQGQMDPTKDPRLNLNRSSRREMEKLKKMGLEDPAMDELMAITSGGDGGGGGVKSKRSRRGGRTEERIKEYKEVVVVGKGEAREAARHEEARGGEEQPPQPQPEKKGLFDGWKAAFNDVNQQSYAQAMALNKQLEDKGILKPINPQAGDGGGGDGDVDKELVTADSSSGGGGGGGDGTKKGAKKSRKRTKQ